MINQKRMIEEFMQLTAIDTPSFGERQMADLLKEKLEKLGFEVSEDDAGSLMGGNAGNVYGYLPGTIPGDPILFSAHMDTVNPAIGKEAVLSEDGIFRSKGDTVLGGDDASGILAILEGIRSLREDGKAHRSIEAIFFAAEEVFSKGAALFDYSTLKSREAYVLDMSGKPGRAALKAPSIIAFEAEVTGKASHAGFAPKEGINAIDTAVKAISQIQQGQVDEISTLNVGTMEGGIQRNIVSDYCRITGEARSFDHERALSLVEGVRKSFEKAAEITGAQVEFHIEVCIQAYALDEEEQVLVRFRKACSELGLSPVIEPTLGGSDNNNLALHGIRGAVIACGMEKVHTVDEYVDLKDMVAAARLAERLMESEI